MREDAARVHHTSFFWIGVALLTLATLHTGCNRSECVATGDCEAGLVCDVASEQCVARSVECSINADCTGEGELCLTDSASGESVCRVPADCSEVDSVSVYCRAQLGDDDPMARYTCDASKRCVREEGCAEDASCATGEVCEQHACVATCESAASCVEGEACVARGEGRVGALCGSCTSGEQCERGEDEQAFCVDGECRYQPITYGEGSYGWIVIEDTSSGTAACDSNDPGSDLLGVALRDASDNFLGWGVAGNFELGFVGGGRENNYPTPGRLNGTANDLTDSRSCPEGNPRFGDFNPTPFSMGCGGKVLVQFVNAAGTGLPLAIGSRIDVLEYGADCGRGGDDSYEIYLCTDDAEANLGGFSSCTFAIGQNSQGLSSFPIMNLPQP